MPHKELHCGFGGKNREEKDQNGIGKKVRTARNGVGKQKSQKDQIDKQQHNSIRNEIIPRGLHRVRVDVFTATFDGGVQPG